LALAGEFEFFSFKATFLASIHDFVAITTQCPRAFVAKKIASITTDNLKGQVFSIISHTPHRTVYFIPHFTDTITE
jgi:hypothetical protein